jgi:hypothetical protein
MNHASSSTRPRLTEPVLVAARQRQPTAAAEAGLRIRFIWAGDRYQSLVEIGPAAARPTFQAVGGDALPDWPDDPPLQQLSIERLGDRTVALGVGSAGTSHWSISIEAVPGPVPAFRYDLACRCQVSPPHLGSAFEFLEPIDPVECSTEKGVVVNGVAGGILRFVPAAAIGTWEPRLDPAGRRLALVAALGSDPQPATYRWGFCLQWEPPTDAPPSGGKP